MQGNYLHLFFQAIMAANYPAKGGRNSLLFAITKLYSVFKVLALHRAVNQTQLNFDIKSCFYQLLCEFVPQNPCNLSDFSGSF